MFAENSIEFNLEALFKTIFKVKKVSFDAAGEHAQEQQCLFIQIETTRDSIKDTVQKSMVTGNAFMVAQNDQIPLGYFSKAIKQADLSLTKDLFFFDIEANTQRSNNLVKRGFSFTYFFSSQYDPQVGTITSVDITIEEQ